MANGIVRLTDNARTLRDRDAMTSNEYLDVIDRIDNIIIDTSKRCKCKKI
jgi:hypothetical protein